VRHNLVSNPESRATRRREGAKGRSTVFRGRGDKPRPDIFGPGLSRAEQRGGNHGDAVLFPTITFVPRGEHGGVGEIVAELPSQPSKVSRVVVLFVNPHLFYLSFRSNSAFCFAQSYPVGWAS